MASSPLEAALTHLRNGDTGISTFGEKTYPHKFGIATKVDIFDVKHGEGELHRGLDETALRRHLKDDIDADGNIKRIRAIFLDGDENNAERLPITSDALQHIFKTYNISHRFAFFLSKQRMAGSSVHHERDSRQPRRLEFWYTAVIRSQANHTPDGSRKVMNWLRFFAWSSFDSSTGSSTSLIFRYPVHLKDRFIAEFDRPSGAVLEQHPMLIHACFLERITTLTREVHFSLCDPMYKLEEELGKGPTCSIRLFEIARELTEYYRKMRQVKTDIDIVMGSARELRRLTAVLADMLQTCADRDLAPEPSYELQMQLDSTFDSVERELELCAVYLGLYSERCNTSLTIAHSLSNQRSAEVQLKSSEELTSLSRDSKEDNRSLRVIQLLGAVFLPASLISSIFGMGFFTTDVDESSEEKRVMFAVSQNIWWFPAVALPLTAIIVLLIVKDWIWGRVQWGYEWGRRTSLGSDLEKALMRKSQ